MNKRYFRLKKDDFNQQTSLHASSTFSYLDSQLTGLSQQTTNYGKLNTFFRPTLPQKNKKKIQYVESLEKV